MGFRELPSGRWQRCRRRLTHPVIPGGGRPLPDANPESPSEKHFEIPGLRLLRSPGMTIYFVIAARSLQSSAFMTRIAVGGFLHETNTFAPTKATYEAFVHGGGWPSP